MEEGVYTNASLGLTAELGEDWLVADDQQLAQLAGVVSDTFVSEQLQDALESGSTVYDLYALRKTDGASLNVTVQDLGRLGGIMVDEDYYADVNMENLPEAMASGGVTVEKLEKTTLEFAGETHTALLMESTVGSTKLYQTMALVKVGSYMVCVTATSYDEAASPADILALFRPFEAPTEDAGDAAEPPAGN